MPVRDEVFLTMKTTFALITAVSLAVAPAVFAADKEKTQPAASPGSTTDTISMSQGADQATQSPAAEKGRKDATHPGAQEPLNGTNFAKKAALAGMTEVALGKIAEQKATAPAVKEFGKMMVTDHTAAGDKLKAIAAEKKIELPAALEKMQQAKVSKIEALEGAAFDKAYVESQVKAHEKAVALFKEASTNCSDSELKSFALATLPTLESHLAKIKAIQKTMM